MLTVDYERLGVGRGERLLDLGCGGGRHAFQAVRLRGPGGGPRRPGDEVAQVRDTIGAMVDAGEVRLDDEAGVVQGDALRLPFADGSFDRVIAVRGARAHPRGHGSAMAELSRVLRPGGTMAVTVPRFGPEVVNWALSNEYHDVPGGHVRIYRRSHAAGAPAAAPGCVRSASHHAHALHSPYWWLRVPGGTRARRPPGRARPITGSSSGTSRSAPWLTRITEHVLNPAARQEPRRLPGEAGMTRTDGSLPIDGPSPRRDPCSSPGRAGGADPRDPRRAVSARRWWRRPRSIAEVQLHDGMIPWFEGGHCDPWNHVEVGHGPQRGRLPQGGHARLPVAGRHPAARRVVVQLLPGRPAA